MIKQIESSLEKTARLIAQQWDIKVIFKHDTAMTDGKTIYLPVFPEDAPQEIVNALIGLMDHEVSHCVYTDRTIFDNKKPSRKFHFLWNTIEDPRVNRCISEVWRGAAVNINAAYEWSCKEHENVDKDGKTALQRATKVAAIALINCIRMDMPASHPFFRTVDPALLAKARQYEDVWIRGKAAPSTKETYALTEELLRRLGEDDDEDIRQEVRAIGTEEGYEAGWKIGLSDQLIAILQGNRKDGTSQVYSVYTTEGDKITPVTSKTANPELRDSSASAQTMRRRLSNLLRGRSVSRWEVDKTRGAINPRVLHRVANGTSSRVFRQRVEAESYDTAVQMMIDHSGSMQGGPLATVSKVAYLLGEICSQLAIPFSVAGFTTGDGSEGDMRLRQSRLDRQAYTRWGDLKILMYKDFDAGWLGNRNNLGAAMSFYEGQNTYDAESLKWGAVRLTDRKERRKILFWLNDGAPCPNWCDNHKAHEEYLLKLIPIVASHVELIAIGLSGSTLNKYYKDAILIRDVKDLAGTCLGQLERLLIKNKKLAVTR